MNGNGDNRATIGVISDTHGHLAAEILRIFSGVDMILHAGDIDSAKPLRALEGVAPVVAVQGNMDRGSWTRHLNQTELIEIGQTGIYLIHDLYHLDIDPGSIGVKAVVHGHTHRAKIHEREGVLFINPGSASLPRIGASPSIGLLSIRNNSLTPRIVYLKE